MADIVNEAVEAGVICGPARKAQKTLDIKRFLKHILEHGPDERMEANTIRTGQGGEVFDIPIAARFPKDFLDHLISRLEAK